MNICQRGKHSKLFFASKKKGKKSKLKFKQKEAIMSCHIREAEFSIGNTFRLADNAFNLFPPTRGCHIYTVAREARTGPGTKIIFKSSFKFFIFKFIENLKKLLKIE